MELAIMAILFDLDGTLLDTTKLNLISFVQTLREAGYHALDEDIIETFGVPLPQAMAMLTGDAPDTAELVERYRIHNRLHHDAMVEAMPHAEEVLRELRANGKQIAVVTSKGRMLSERGLTLRHLLRHIDSLVAMEDTAEHKPQPEPVLTALRRLGRRPEEALMIGDSPYDILAGKAAGTRTAGLLGDTFRRDDLLAVSPDVIFTALPQVLVYLQGENNRWKEGAS